VVSKMADEYRGKFIVLEGLDGAGTTTQSSRLAKYLFEKEKRNTVLVTREPTDLSPNGKELRRRLRGELLSGEEVIHDAQYWADLFVNDRKWHLNEFVVPAVNRGQHVISDRHKLSTLAYQTTQGHDMDHLINMHNGLYLPDLTLFLDVSSKIALDRINIRGTGTVNAEYFERTDFLARVCDNYQVAIDKLKATENIAVIDGTKPIDDVEKLIQAEIDKLFGYKSKS